MSALEVEATREVIAVSQDDSKQEVTEQSKQDITRAVKELIKTALDAEAGADVQQSFRTATDRLLETGLSPLPLLPLLIPVWCGLAWFDPDFYPPPLALPEPDHAERSTRCVT